MDLQCPRFAGPEAVFGTRLTRVASLHRFPGLWLAGDPAGLHGPAVAVVGARAPSEPARQRAQALASALVQSGICIVSGLALGIDGAAHLGALLGGGRTVGVLGGGHRCFYPSHNRRLGERIVANGGAVLSPYPPDEPARPGQFLRRNGIVAALADVVIVVEASERSGALNTASWAASLGVDVLAFPGDVDRPKAAGTNALIRDGATLVRHAGDVLEALGMAGSARDKLLAHTPSERLDPLERTLLAELGGGPRSLDALLAATGGATPELLAALMRLELEGAVVRNLDSSDYASSNALA